jgi:signal transduction histidine kinase
LLAGLAAVEATASQLALPLPPGPEPGLLAVLMWAALVADARVVGVLGGWALISLPLHGASYGLAVASIDAPHRVGIALLMTVIVAAVGFASVLEQLTHTVLERTRESMAALEARQRALVERLEARTRDLQISQDQLAQAQKLKTVGTMAAGIAHELNNYLTPIAGFAEILAAGASAELAADYGRRIRKSANDAAAITRALLTYSRQGEFTPVRANGRQMLQADILPVLQKSLPRDVHLETQLERDVDVVVDRRLFQQCVTNLVQNATQALPNGGAITVTLRKVKTADVAALDRGAVAVSGDTARVRLGGEHCELTVADSGQGIAPDVLERIFDPFFTTKGPGSGHGLGLSTVQGIVSRHGGAIEVRSQPGRGAAFTIRLPLAPAEASRDAPLPGAGGPESPGPVVVVVDGDQDFLDEIEEVLLALRCRPLCTMDLRAAAALLLELGERFDLVVLDLDLGAGTERLLDKVRSAMPELPIVLMGHRADLPRPPDPRVKVLRKPVDAGTFQTIVTGLVDLRGAAHSSRTSAT